MKSVKMGLAPKLIAVAFMIVAGVAMAAPSNRSSSGTPTPSASGGTLTNINLTVDACNGVNGSLDVTATGTVNDGGGNDTIWFTIFDDFVEKFAQQINIPVGSTTTTHVIVSYPGVVGTSVPGIALLLGETRDSNEFVDMDPFFPTVISGCGSISVVPTTSNWALVILASMLGLLGLGVLIRRNRT